MTEPLLSNAERRLLDSLRRRKARTESDLFLVEGVRVAEELLAAGIVPKLVVVSSAIEDSERGRALRARLDGPAMRCVPDHVLARLADTETPQGVLIAAPLPATTLAEIAPPDDALVLLLDAVQDPGNFGTLVRSAAAFGASAVIALPGTVDPWHPKSVRSAAGASFHVPMVSAPVDAAFVWLRRHSFSVFVAAADGTPLENMAVPRRMALVVGNEGAGVSEAVRARADGAVAVEMRGRAESLNVGVAAGILLHHFSHGRH